MYIYIYIYIYIYTYTYVCVCVGVGNLICTDKICDFGKWTGRKNTNADLSHMYTEVPDTYFYAALPELVLIYRGRRQKCSFRTVGNRTNICT
jgi:hypothetical protein